jgi:hypothetical protein
VSYTVRYIGGQLGGQTDFMYGAFNGQDIRVPIRAEVRFTEADTHSSIIPAFQVDTYRHRGEQRDGSFVYRWVRPNVEGLHDRIHQLERELNEALAPPLRAGLMRFSR